MDGAESTWRTAESLQLKLSGVGPHKYTCGDALDGLTCLAQQGSLLASRFLWLKAIQFLSFLSSPFSLVDTPTVSVWTVPATLNHGTRPLIFLFFPSEIITSTAVVFSRVFGRGRGSEVAVADAG
jgi:hypothetical protein